MPILAKEIIEIPAKSFDKLWSVDIHITSPIPEGEVQAACTLLPYNSDLETAPNKAIFLNIENIKAEAVANPTSNAAKAVHFILAYVNEKYLASLVPQQEE